MAKFGSYFEQKEDPITKKTKLEMQKEDIFFLGLCAESEELEMF